MLQSNPLCKNRSGDNIKQPVWNSHSHVNGKEAVQEYSPKKRKKENKLKESKKSFKNNSEKLKDCQPFLPGELIWAKWAASKWWPAIVINPLDCGRSSTKPGHSWVFWLGDHKISEVSRAKILNFIPFFNAMEKHSSGKLQKAAITETLEILANMKDLSFIDNVYLLKWANDGFKNLDINSETLRSFSLQYIKKYLKDIQTGKEKEDNLVDFDESDLFFEKLQSEELKIEEICISCQKKKPDLSEHPIFIGGLCLSCKEDLEDTIFAVGDDGKNICCIVCSEPGLLILCDNTDCSRTYCKNCIISFLGKTKASQVFETSPWFCFFCCSSEINDCFLKIKNDWEKNLLSLFTKSSVENEIELSQFTEKKPITVLSLFDGIGTGKHVLDLLGFSINKYYACEIDEDAINVGKLHHKDSITYLGDVTELDNSKIDELENIDLLIGGSPCNDLSLVNHARKGLYDDTGTGCLFFHFFHILCAVKKRNPNVFYLFENVAAMLHTDKAIISSFFTHEPVLIDAKYFSPQARARYFWGNIPGLHSLANFWSSPSDKTNENVLSDCILWQNGRKAVVEKIRTVTTNRNSLVQQQYSVLPVIMEGKPDILWVTELEQIFGFPLHYTDTGNMGVPKRRALLGRSWSVPVIKAIFQPLKNFFELK